MLWRVTTFLENFIPVLLPLQNNGFISFKLRNAEPLTFIVLVSTCYYFKLLLFHFQYLSDAVDQQNKWFSFPQCCDKRSKRYLRIDNLNVTSWFCHHFTHRQNSCLSQKFRLSFCIHASLSKSKLRIRPVQSLSIIRALWRSDFISMIDQAYNMFQHRSLELSW